MDMLENKENKILEAKLDTGWNRNENADNFFELGEITVTITLAEYRRLVRDNAILEKKASEYLHEKLRIESECEELRCLLANSDKKEEE